MPMEDSDIWPDIVVTGGRIRIGDSRRLEYG